MTTAPVTVPGTSRSGLRPARAGVGMAIGSMLLVQLGLAAAVGLLDQAAPATIAWLRLAWAGLILAVLVRPRPARMGRRAVLSAALLGLVTATLTMLFMAAIARLPLGTASALEFLGPLGVAVLSRRGVPVRWPLLAGIGVLLLTQPWHGVVDPVGVGLALAAAVCWAAYILLTQRVGDAAAGLQGLAVSMTVAGLASTAVVPTVTRPALDVRLVFLCLGLAVLVPLLPFSLEMLALRRLTTSAFGTLMSLEPAIALAIGFVVLGQTPGLGPLFGVGCVVAAGVAAERHGGRPAAGPGDGLPLEPAVRARPAPPSPGRSRRWWRGTRHPSSRAAATPPARRQDPRG